MGTVARNSGAASMPAMKRGGINYANVKRAIEYEKRRPIGKAELEEVELRKERALERKRAEERKVKHDTQAVRNVARQQAVQEQAAKGTRKITGMWRGGTMGGEGGSA